MDFLNLLVPAQTPGQTRALCNRETQAEGLALTQAQAEKLQRAEQAVLRCEGRVRFGASALPALARTFCRSRCVDGRSWAAQLERLTEIFYAFRAQLSDRFPDETLLQYLYEIFETEAGGSFTYLETQGLRSLERRLNGQTEEAKGEDEIWKTAWPED